MLYFLSASIQSSKGYIKVQELFTDVWDIEKSIYSKANGQPYNEHYQITFYPPTSPKKVGAIVENVKTGEFIIRLDFVFSSNAAFSILQSDSNNEKIADFDFLTTLHPHMTSTGKWNNSLYTAEFISRTSAHVLIYNNSNHEMTELTLIKRQTENAILKLVDWIQGFPLIVVLIAGKMFSTVIRTFIQRKAAEKKINHPTDEGVDEKVKNE